MTENKRFVLYEHKGADYILENPNTHLDFIEMLGDCLDEEEIVERLNELYDENEQLKKDNKEYIRGLDLSKATSQSWASDVRELREQNCQLEKENEQLKQYAQTSKKFTEYVEDFFKKYGIDTVNFDSLGEMIDTDNFFYEKSLKLEKENEQLKQDRKRLIGYLWKYKSMDMEEIEEYILSRELLDEYGEAIMDE